MSSFMKGRSGVGGEGMSSSVKGRSGVGGEDTSSSVKGRSGVGGYVFVHEGKIWRGYVLVGKW